MYDKDAMDDYAQQAALVHALASEFLREVPLTHGEQLLQRGFIAIFEGGDMQLELVLQSALCEKSPTFKVSGSNI